MTLPKHVWNALELDVRRAVATIERYGSVEQSIEGIELLDNLRKTLDRIQANPQLLTARAKAMPARYKGVEERQRLAGTYPRVASGHDPTLALVPAARPAPDDGV